VHRDHARVLDRMPVTQKNRGLRSFCSVWWLLCGLLLVASPVLAADGVLEINQVCVSGGCFAGDGAGFPVTITTPGAYRLTTDLVVPIDGGYAIDVQTSDVSIDLHGFAILGESCAATGGVCGRTTGAGGVTASLMGSSTFWYSGISVRNGTIAGMSRTALRLGDHAVVSNMIVRHAAGIIVGEGSIVQRSVFESTNTSMNIASIVSENVAKHSTHTGILINAASVVVRNTLYENEDDAIISAVGSGGSVFLGNSIYRNGGAGAVVAYATIANNTVYENGTDTGSFFRDGIRASSSLVHGNAIHGNGGAGLWGSRSGYRENVISDNGGGTVTGFGMVNLNGNLCNGVSGCP